MRFLLLLSVSVLAGAQPAHFKVAVDAYHNNEDKMPQHYRWEGTNQGGFSELGKVLQGMGGELQSIGERLNAKNLGSIDCLIIVDPDTPAETSDPKYLEKDEIDAVEKWALGGGRLVLLGNDKGNAEFRHFNQLAARFGIEFEETVYRNKEGKSKLTILTSSPLLGAPGTFYAVDVAPLKVPVSAQVMLAEEGTALMALVPASKGSVFALGDPWIYNEYIDTRDNRRLVTAAFRNLMTRR
ncbi:MAG: hypothetical protein ABJF23_29310 [Bryobacteraceae bacterium]